MKFIGLPLLVFVTVIVLTAVGRFVVKGRQTSFAAPTPLPPSVAHAAPDKPSAEAIALANVPLKEGLVFLTFHREHADPSVGTGFLVGSQKLVATTYQLVSDAVSGHAQFADGTRAEIRGCRAVDKTHDLVLLELERLPENARSFTLSKTDDTPSESGATSIGTRGDALTAVGFVKGPPHRTSLLALDRQGPLKSMGRLGTYLSTALALPGHQHIVLYHPLTNETEYVAGEPILRKDGEVVAITASIQVPPICVGYHIRHIHEILRKIAPNPTTLAELTAKERQFDFTRNLDGNLLTIYQKYAGDRQNLLLQLYAAQTEEDYERIIKSNNIFDEAIAALTAYQVGHEREASDLFATLLIYHIATSNDWSGLPSLPAHASTSADRLVDRFVHDPLLFPALFLLARDPSERTRGLFARLGDKSTNRATRGATRLLLAVNQAQYSRGKYRSRYDAIALLDEVIKDYGDVQAQDQSLGDLAKRLRFALEHLLIGGVAAPINGMDANGNAVSTDDFRGKVVLLFHFVDWCPACRTMYPILNQLQVTQNADDVAILGVLNGQKDVHARLATQGLVTWTCILDAEEQGSIVDTWQIDGYPTVFIIDKEGVIRFRDYSSSYDDLREAIQSLLDEQKRIAHAASQIDIDAELRALRTGMFLTSPHEAVEKAIALLHSAAHPATEEQVGKVESMLASLVKGKKKLLPPDVMFLKAKLQFAKGENADGLEALRKALEWKTIHDEMKAKVQWALARALALQGEKEDLKEAAKLLKEVEKPEDEDVDLQATLAFIQFRLGEVEAARATLESILAKGENPRCLFQLALLAKEQSKDEWAKAIWRDAIAAGFSPASLMPAERQVASELLALVTPQDEVEDE